MFCGHALLASVHRRSDRALAGLELRRSRAFASISHYSSTTTGSSLNEWNRHFRSDIPVHRVETFYRDELYLDALIEKVDKALSRFPASTRAEILFSAHSLPQSIIDKGDPYQRQIEETVHLLMQRGGWPNPHRLCYQSKVGASKWLQPSLHRTLRDLSAEKVRDVCVVPVSFVSDHVETLGEIDHEAREEAHRLGIRQFEMTEGLNESPNSSLPWLTLCYALWANP